MRKDQLAAGARTAKFAVGGTAVPGADDNIFRNVMSEEEAAVLDAAVLTPVEHTPVVKKVFKPRGTTLFVRRVTVEELSSLIITDPMEKDKPAEGFVIAIGKGTAEKPIDVNIGDHVVFGKYSGTEFKLNGEVLLIMDIDDIKGTIEDESNIPYGTGMDDALGGCTNLMRTIGRPDGIKHSRNRR